MPVVTVMQKHLKEELSEEWMKNEIDLNEITEPLLACPNDPDDIKPLSEVANTDIQEVFIGSCMTNIDTSEQLEPLLNKYNGTKARLWVVPPTKNG